VSRVQSNLSRFFTHTRWGSIASQNVSAPSLIMLFKEIKHEISIFFIKIHIWSACKISQSYCWISSFYLKIRSVCFRVCLLKKEHPQFVSVSSAERRFTIFAWDEIINNIVFPFSIDIQPNRIESIYLI